MNEERCCGTCKWHWLEEITFGEVCVNADSDDCTEFTENDHTCDYWESKESEE